MTESWRSHGYFDTPVVNVRHPLLKAGIGSILLALAICPCRAIAQGNRCAVEPVDYKGWNAQELSNSRVKLILVPQLGGRLMQVEFDGHSYLFTNPKFEGKYIAPEQAADRWINYGGDKIWPMPEGNRDEQHWVLESSVLDDGAYAFKVLEQGAHCSVEMDGPVDDKTGLQYSRRISLDGDSSAIHFHAVMRNATSHTLHWSMQSVSQYNLASSTGTGRYNHNFWAYTAARPDSSYLNGFEVRSGLADDPSFRVRDGLFRLHWMYLDNEVWIDSPGGWLTVADGESGFAMIERFDFDPAATYPGKATVIFYKNGPSVEFDAAGNPKLSASEPLETPYYMEAEVNSPLVDLKPGATYSMDTAWFPLQIGSPDIENTTEAGIVTKRLEATQTANQVKVSGSFGVVVAGHLDLRVFDAAGRDTQRVTLEQVSPEKPIDLNRNISVDFAASRVALHLIDEYGSDWGVLDVARVSDTGGDR